jgi:hypothetical protein
MALYVFLGDTARRKIVVVEPQAHALERHMSASSIMKVSRRYPSSGFFRWSPITACFSHSCSQKSRETH